MLGAATNVRQVNARTRTTLEDGAPVSYTPLTLPTNKQGENPGGSLYVKKNTRKNAVVES